MQLPLFIAQRYLFSKKKQNAINLISAISIVGVTIGTTALIVVLSVFNGMDLLLQKSTDSFTSDIVVSPSTGKFVHFDSSFYNLLSAHPSIVSYNNIIEEKAIATYGNKPMPVIVKGVDETYAQNTHFQNNILEGEFELKNEDTYKAVIGYGIAAELGVGLNSLTPLLLYYPNKNAGMNMASLNSEPIYPTAYFISQQDIEGQYIITDINFARKLFKTGNKISKIEIKLKHPSLIPDVKKQLQTAYPQRYCIEDKYELNKAFYAMMKSEKLAVFMILLFILLIASFNIIGSISMLILDKKEDLSIYKAMGMTTSSIIKIFKTEGNLITLSGTLLGLVLGIIICLLQEKFGIITLGDGSYIIDAYPVKLVFNDISIIIFTVLLIGYTASYFPVRYLVKKLVKNENMDT